MVPITKHPETTMHFYSHFPNERFREWLRSMLREHGGPFFDAFRSKHPERYWNAPRATQLLVRMILFLQVAHIYLKATTLVK